MIPPINLLENLADVDKVEIFDAFVKKCKDNRHKDGNQIISYSIAIEMMEDIGVELGCFPCPHCGIRKRK